MRWIIRIVFGLIALVVLAVVALFLLPAERIAGLVTDQFEAATGRAMTLQGDVRPTLWPELGVNTGPVTIANAAWSDAGPMLAAERLSIGVDIGALLGGTVRIRRIEADAPKILLEIAADGRGNWDMATGGGAGADAAGEAAAPTAGLPAFTLDRAVISDGSVTLIDHAGGSRTELSAIDATLRLPDFQGAAELEMTAAMNGQSFDLTAQISEFAGFLAEGAVPVSAAFRTGGSTVDFSGRAGLDPVAAGGKLTAEIADMAAVMALIGQSAPDIPRGFGRQIGVSGDVTLTDAGNVTLRDGVISLDQNRFAGAVDLLMAAARPKMTASLVAGALDFSAAVTEGGEPAAGAAGDGAAPAGWSRTPIDASALQLLDAEIALQADSIDLGLAQLGRTRTVTTLADGRAVTEIRELAAYDGTVAGSVVINSRGGLSSRATLNATGVALQPLLQQMAGYDRLLASGDVSLNLLGVGDNLNALMNGLSGGGSVTLGQGELRGLDLAGMLRTLDTSYVGAGAKTIFDGISGTFTVDGGVLGNTDLKLTAPLLGATGAGTVGIGAQTLDYRVMAALLEGQTNGGLNVPVLISGPWANPKIRLDLESLAGGRLAEEADKLKVQAEDLVKERLQDELGTKIEDTEGLQDTLKQELEDRAKKGLLDLLGGN